MEQHVYFKNIREEIINLLESAQNEILIAVAWFTDTKIIDVLNKARRRGVVIHILFYDDKVNNKKLFEQLHYNSVDIRVSKKLMHNKFCIIDNKIIINGSYNWTINASTNNENIQVSINNSLLVSKFKNEFYELQQRCEKIDNFFKYSTNIIHELEEEFNLFFESTREKIEFPYFKRIEKFKVNEAHKYHKVKLQEKSYVLIVNPEEQYNFYRYIFYLSKDFNLQKLTQQTKKEFIVPKIYTNINNIDNKNIIVANKDKYLVEKILHLIRGGSEKKVFYIDNYGNIINNKVYHFRNKNSVGIYFLGIGKETVYFLDKELNEINTKLKAYEYLPEIGIIFYDYTNNIKLGIADVYGNIIIEPKYSDYKVINDNTIELYEYPAVYTRYDDNYDEIIVELYKRSRHDWNADKNCYKVHIYDSHTKKTIATNQIFNKEYNIEYFFNSDDNYLYSIFYQHFSSRCISLSKFKELKRKFYIEVSSASDSTKKSWAQRNAIFYGYKLQSVKEKTIQKTHNNNNSCYIATMVYNDINHPNVERLRNFRDEVLLLNTFGKIFVKYYYKISPWVVEKFGRYKLLHIVAKSIIEKIILKHIKSKY